MLPSNSKSIHSPHFSFLNWIVVFFFGSLCQLQLKFCNTVTKKEKRWKI